MDRIQEYNALLAEIDNNTPPALDYVITRVQAREKKVRNIRKFFFIPASGITAVFIVFVIMVNLFPTFVMACEGIPVLRELATAVLYSPSLSKAVKNDYVQPIGLEQTENGTTMRVEYVIVDQKQLNIFYTLQSQQYSRVGINYVKILNSDGEEFSSTSLFSDSGLHRKNGELCQYSVNFLDGDMPNSIILEFETCKLEGTDLSYVYYGEECIATFNFTLNFDPQYKQQGEVITLNKDIVLDVQNFTVTTVEIYPTQAWVTITEEEDNAAELGLLEFCFMDEKGNIFELPPNTRYFSVNDSPKTYFLESPFFYQSSSITMYITEVEMIYKDVVKVDLANGVADRLPEGMELETVRKGNAWELVFSSIQCNEYSFYSLSRLRGYDENDNEYLCNGFIDNQTQGKSFARFTLEDYPYDTVYLNPVYSHIVKLETPVEISIK